MRAFCAVLLFVAACAHGNAEQTPSQASDKQPLSLVVMDPLAEPLSCPCVQGYAQRKYEKLAEFLETQLQRPVHVTFAESFEKALAKESCKVIDIAIGKDSVVRADAANAKLKVTPIARLTGLDGLTTQTGLVVVRSADAAKRLEDLRGYRVIYGPSECDEKFAAARKLLKSAGLEIPPVRSMETSASCSDGACKIIEWGDAQHAAAVISSYAAPLLHGCGTVKKGDLRVVAETQPVPFITAFTTNRVEQQLQQQIREALLASATKVELRSALESLLGFVEINEEYFRQLKAIKEDAPSETTGESRFDETPAKRDAPPAAASSAASAWPQFRGPTRDGHVSHLPKTLPDKPHIVWRKPLQRPGLGGIAATEKLVILGDRDLTNKFDEFRCFSAKDGEVLWTVRYPATGELDYDNMPRATPLIDRDKAFLLGAFGDLSCVELATGVLLWQINMISQFDGEKKLVWGTCSSPLMCDGKLIVNPGGKHASVVALDPESGEVLWQTPGDRHAHSSFIVATLGGVRQIVGYDQSTLGGWDIASGRRLWTLAPPHKGDFNVPTPVAFEGKLFVATENNYARIYAFDKHGQIIPQPLTTNDRLAPDISSPVVVGNRVFCVCEQMFCLNLADGLQPIWIGEDAALGSFSPLIASSDRVLAFGRGGELLLVDATTDHFQIVSRLHLFADKASRQAQLLSQPALVGKHLYLRGEKDLVCADLEQEANR